MEGSPSAFDSFYEAVRYIFSTYVNSAPHRPPGLDRDVRQPWHTRQLLDGLCAPDRLLRTIKVTGSKGKGSTARIIAGLLQVHGYRVGLFSSPHLVDFTERIRVDGRAIGESEFMEILADIRPLADRLAANFAPHEYFGPVGLVAVVACIYFARRATDVNVVELGRGARHDDVNQVAGEWAVLTPVLREHAEQLGPDIRSIIDNKAGVMDDGMRGVILGRQSPEALAQLLREAERLALPVRRLGGGSAGRAEECFDGRRGGRAEERLDEQFGVEGVTAAVDGVRFSLWTGRRVYGAQHLSLQGRHQADNAAVAVAAAEAFHGAPLDPEAVRRHLGRLAFPGRCQVIQGNPAVLIDGAINRESANYVSEFIGTLGVQSVISVIAVPADKDYVGVLEVMAAVSEQIIVTCASNPHLEFPADALEVATRMLPSETAADLEEAVGKAKRRLGAARGLIAVVGTQSLVADALRYYGVDTRDMAEVIQPVCIAGSVTAPRNAGTV